jgi:Arc/MetJ family transcription regulator
MSRINVNIDDEACAEVMHRYLLTTKQEAINLALRTLAVAPLDVEEARRMRGSGWDGELGELRSIRIVKPDSPVYPV